MLQRHVSDIVFPIDSGKLSYVVDVLDCEVKESKLLIQSFIDLRPCGGYIRIFEQVSVWVPITRVNLRGN